MPSADAAYAATRSGPVPPVSRPDDGNAGPRSVNYAPAWCSGTDRRAVMLCLYAYFHTYVLIAGYRAVLVRVPAYLCTENRHVVLPGSMSLPGRPRYCPPYRATPLLRYVRYRHTA
eukprot:3533735-Rhodomonas_salina.3